MDELAKIFPVQSCAFPQLDNSVLTIHLSFLHKKQKYTLRNHYSIAAVNTQRVNCKFLRSLIRQRLCLITFLGMLHFLRGILFQFIQNLIKQYHEQLGKYSTGDVVTVTAMRKGAEGYAEMTFDVTMGEV